MAFQTLKCRRIAKTQLSVTELGLGCAALGNLYSAISDDEARDTVNAAVDGGIGYVDTAPFYGFGLSERRVGDALRRRSGMVVSTKVGRLLQPDRSVTNDDERSGFRSAMPFSPTFDYTYEGVMKSWSASLQRMGLARIDLLYLHDVGKRTHGASCGDVFRQLASGGGFRALEQLRGDGEVSAIGLGVNEIQACFEVMERIELDAILLAGRYTLLEQDALESLLPLCASRSVSIVIGGPYNSGILVSGTRTSAPLLFDYGKAAEPIVAKVRRIEAVCDRFEVPLAAAALQFPLAHPQVVSVIPGVGSRSNVRETLAWYHTSIPADFWRELAAQGLVREDAPVPRPVPCQ
jgi:D-threo-aldose 1-dehydrogenase